jgi:PqqD family protein of HPr-rel-A system
MSIEQTGFEPELHHDVVFRPVGEEGVVIDQRKPEVIVVNALGLRVLQLLKEDISLAGLLKSLEDEYEAPAEEIRADVARFLDELRERGMLA